VDEERSPCVTLEKAVLLALVSWKKAVPAPAVLNRLDQFLDHAHSLADVQNVLRALEATRPPEVIGTGTKDFGILWKETADGRLRALE